MFKKILIYLGFQAFLFFGLSAQPISSYLQADFDFMDGSLADGSPNAINGIGTDLSSASGLEGTPNGAFLFNGTSSYIDCGTDNRNVSDQLTISAWFKTSTSDRQIIVSKYDLNDDRGYFLGIFEGEASLEGRDGSTVFYRLTSEGINVADGQWHHLVGTIDQNEWKLYLDCQLVKELTTTSVAPQFAITDPLTIGRLSVMTGTGEYRYFNGVIDNVELYNFPLSAEELPELSGYFCPADNLDLSNGLVAYYPLNGDVLDYSGNDLHGMLNGAIPTMNQFGAPNTAYQFDGQDDYITVEHNELINFGIKPFAIAVWIQAYDPEGPPQMVLQKGVSGVDPQYWIRVSGYDETTQLRGVIGDGTPPSTILASTTPHFNDLNWHHVVFQRTINAIEFWVDGVLVLDLEDSRYRNVNNNSNLIIGAQTPWPEGGNFPFIHNHFQGNLDEIRLYNRFLTVNEISILANNYCPDNLVIEEAEPQLEKYQTAGELSTVGDVLIAKNTIFQAGETIILKPGFRTQPGVDFLAKIEDCTTSLPNEALTFPIPVALENINNDEKGEVVHRNLKVSPNPFNSNVEVTIQLGLTEKASLQVVDINGKRVNLAFASRILDAGDHLFQLDLSDLAPGMYFLHLRTANQQLTKKIIKIR